MPSGMALLNVYRVKKLCILPIWKRSWPSCGRRLSLTRDHTVQKLILILKRISGSYGCVIPNVRSTIVFCRGDPCGRPVWRADWGKPRPYEIVLHDWANGLG